MAGKGSHRLGLNRCAQQATVVVVMEQPLQGSRSYVVQVSIYFVGLVAIMPRLMRAEMSCDGDRIEDILVSDEEVVL